MRRARRRRGLTLVEIMVATLILALTVSAAVAVFPLASMLRESSGNYTRAAAIAQRKLEQVRKLPASQITYSGLRAAGVIDEGSTQPYRFTAVDNLTADLGRGAGTLTVTGAGTDLVRVDVTVSWRTLGRKTRSVTATTYVASKEVWLAP